MAIYEYRCPRCGVFDVVRPIGSAPGSHACARCGSDANRSYTAPHLTRGTTPLHQALARAEQSRDEPEVVTRVPPRSGTRPV